MQVLLVNGSPHAKGCTWTALSEVAAELERQGVGSPYLSAGHAADCGLHCLRSLPQNRALLPRRQGKRGS